MNKEMNRYYFHPGHVRLDTGERTYYDVHRLSVIYGIRDLEQQDWRAIMATSLRPHDIPRGWHLFPIPVNVSFLTEYPFLVDGHDFFRERDAVIVLLGLGYARVNDEYFAKQDENQAHMWRFVKLIGKVGGKYVVQGFSKVVLPE